MKRNTGHAIYALLLVPLLVGSAVVWLTIYSASSSTNGTQLEGALFMMALLGWGLSLVLPPLVVAIAVYALRVRPVPFLAFFGAVLVALAPVAYFQCANLQSSILLALLSQGVNSPDLDHAYPRLVTEAFAIFSTVVFAATYALYRTQRTTNAER